MACLLRFLKRRRQFNSIQFRPNKCATNNPSGGSKICKETNILGRPTKAMEREHFSWAPTFVLAQERTGPPTTAPPRATCSAGARRQLQLAATVAPGRSGADQPPAKVRPLAKFGGGGERPQWRRANQLPSEEAQMELGPRAAHLFNFQLYICRRPLTAPPPANVDQRATLKPSLPLSLSGSNLR